MRERDAHLEKLSDQYAIHLEKNKEKVSAICSAGCVLQQIVVTDDFPVVGYFMGKLIITGADAEDEEEIFDGFGGAEQESKLHLFAVIIQSGRAFVAAKRLWTGLLALVSAAKTDPNENCSLTKKTDPDENSSI